ncbi:MAG: hypothetical protein ACPGWR_11225 [Ardenticatenaceae bacterium]
MVFLPNGTSRTPLLFALRSRANKNLLFGVRLVPCGVFFLSLHALITSLCTYRTIYVIEFIIIIFLFYLNNIAFLNKWLFFTTHEYLALPKRATARDCPCWNITQLILIEVTTGLGMLSLVDVDSMSALDLPQRL